MSKQKSPDFKDITLAYGMVKRMNGYAFCYTGDAELVRLGFMIKNTDKTVKPYITVKGKVFLQEVLRPLAENIPEDKPKEDDKKKKVDDLVKSMKAQPKRAYYEPQLDEDDDEDEEDEVDFKKKERVENDSQS